MDYDIMFKEFEFNEKPETVLPGVNGLELPEQKIYCQIDSENIGDDACYTQAASFEEFLEKMDAELAGND